MDILCAQAVLVTVLEEALARIDHEDAGACMGAFLVDDNDAGRDAGAIEEVRGQADDSLDKTALNQVTADLRLLFAPQQYAVGQDDRSLALALERRDEV